MRRGRGLAEVEPAVNALPTLCLDRARDHAKRIMAGGAACEAAGEAGWLAGLPVSIKDLTDVAGVRTTYGSPIFADHVPAKSHPLVERIERKGGIVVAKSNTPEFGAGGSTFNEVFGRTRNPWNTSLTCGGSTGGGSVSVATGEVWLAHGSDHGGSLRRPGTYCSTVGIRPSPGRVTRGTSNNLYSPQSVQGPMARNVPDLALFLDTMAGLCPHDPMTFDAPAVSFSAAVAHPVAPKRVAFTADFSGRFELDRERPRDLHEDGAALRGAGLHRRGSVARFRRRSTRSSWPAQPAVRRRPRAAARAASRQDQARHHLEHRARPQADHPPARLGRARARGPVPAHGRVLAEVRPAGDAGRADCRLRRQPARIPPTINGKKLENYMAGSTLNSAITVTGRPAIAVPCGFDPYGRPVGLQLVGKPRGEAALLQAASLYENLVGLIELLPIDPKPGTVPPSFYPPPSYDGGN